MEERAFGWCFLGAGRLAGKVADRLAASGRHRVVSVWTRRESACREFAGRYGALAGRTLKEAVTARGVDAVYVVTTHESHYSCAARALALGKPVLCEKAFTTDAAQARALFALARERGVYLAEAMWTWFAPVAWGVKRWVEEERFGQILSVRASCHRCAPAYSPRLLDPCRAGGALLDMGVYPITYLCRLFGTPEKVECRGELAGGVDLREEVRLTFPGGGRYAASASLGDSRGGEYLRIRGTEASLTLPFFHTAERAVLRRGHRVLDRVEGPGGYLHEFDTVAGEIRSGLLESPLVPARATVEVMEVLDECRRRLGLVYPFEEGR